MGGDSPLERTARIGADRTRRAVIRAEHRALFEGVAEILFRLDPVGINLVENRDEYEPEAGTIVPRLRTAASAADVQRIVEEEFRRWFGDEAMGSTARYGLAADEIWALWVRVRPAAS